MGVPHLQFYVQTKCPDASYDMDIFNFAKDKPDAAIIVDASTLSYKLSEDLDLICGGQGMVNRYRWVEFIDAFTSAGIKLIFVFAGGLNEDQEGKLNNMTKHHHQRVQEFFTPVFEALKVGEKPELKTRTKALPPYSTESLVKEVIAGSTFPHEVIHSNPGKDADQLMAKLATERPNVIAILTQDSDFLIYQCPSKVRFISVKHLDLKTFKTKCYDREKLAQHFGLKVNQIPLLAILKGNGLISGMELESYHSLLFPDSYEVARKAEEADWHENERNEHCIMISGLKDQTPEGLDLKGHVENILSKLMGKAICVENVRKATEHSYEVELATRGLSREIRRKNYFGRPHQIDLEGISIKNKVTRATRVPTTLMRLLAKRYRAANPGYHTQWTKLTYYEPRPTLRVILPEGNKKEYSFVEAVTSLPSNFTQQELAEAKIFDILGKHFLGCTRSLFIILPDELEVLEKIAEKIKVSKIQAGYPRREALGELVESIFGRPMDDNLLEKVHCSLAAYFLEPIGEEDKWAQLCQLIFKQTGQVPAVMVGCLSTFPPVLEDLDNPDDIPVCAVLYRTVRQRMFGILLHEKPRSQKESLTYKEWCLTGPDSLGEIKDAEAVPAPSCYPGLKHLWSNFGVLPEHQEKNVVMDEVRWTLFVHIVCPGLSPIVLQNLPDPDTLYPVCQLYMMQHEPSKPILYDWEVKLFLLEHIRFQSMLRLKDPKAVFLKIAEKQIVPHPRGVHLATIYTKSPLEHAWLYVGNTETRKMRPLWTSFDGIDFQDIYKRCLKLGLEAASGAFSDMTRNLGQDKKDLIEELYNISTSNGERVKNP